MADNIIKLGVNFKPHSDGQKMLINRHDYKCQHGPYIVDEAMAEVRCEPCGEKLNPIYILKLLANQENRWHENAAAAKAEMQRLDERSRTKCEHCGQITKISRSK